LYNCFKNNKKNIINKGKHEILNLFIYNHLNIWSKSSNDYIENKINNYFSKKEQDLYISIDNNVGFKNKDFYDLFIIIIEDSSKNDVKKYKNEIIDIIKNNFTIEQKIIITNKIKDKIQFVTEEEEFKNNIQEIENNHILKKKNHKNNIISI
jgi:hypothetical protein